MLSFGKKSTIVVADDDADLRSLIRFSLEAANYRVIEAADGFECLHQIIFQRPEALVMDVVMPEMDGVELVQRLRRNAQFRSLPIVAISGYGVDDPRIQELVKGGEVVMLSKPFTTIQLQVALEQAAELQRAAAATLPAAV